MPDEQDTSLGASEGVGATDSGKEVTLADIIQESAQEPSRVTTPADTATGTGRQATGGDISDGAPGSGHQAPGEDLEQLSAEDLDSPDAEDGSEEEDDAPASPELDDLFDHAKEEHPELSDTIETLEKRFGEQVAGLNKLQERALEKIELAEEYEPIKPKIDTALSYIDAFEAGDPEMARDAFEHLRSTLQELYPDEDFSEGSPYFALEEMDDWGPEDEGFGPSDWPQALGDTPASDWDLHSHEDWPQTSGSGPQEPEYDVPLAPGVDELQPEWDEDGVYQPLWMRAGFDSERGFEQARELMAKDHQIEELASRLQWIEDSIAPLQEHHVAQREQAQLLEYVGRELPRVQRYFDRNYHGFGRAVTAESVMMALSEFPELASRPEKAVEAAFTRKLTAHVAAVTSGRRRGPEAIPSAQGQGSPMQKDPEKLNMRDVYDERLRG